MPMLTPEQQQQLQAQLESQQGGVPAGDMAGGLSPEQQQAAMQQGAEMAAADMGGEGAAPQDAAVAPEQAQDNGDAQLLAQYGFGSVEELANAYKQLTTSYSETKDMLSQLSAVQESMKNAEGLDPNDPNYRVKKAIRDELKPLYDKISADARNRIVQDKWSEAAKGKTDLGEHLAEISDYLKANPTLAVSEDGFERAYNAVRSNKYRSKEDYLADPTFLKEMAENDKVKEMVLEKHLQNVARNGDVPQTISSGGNTPMSEPKSVSNLEQAKKILAQRLGMKE